MDVVEAPVDEIVCGIREGGRDVRGRVLWPSYTGAGLRAAVASMGGYARLTG